MNACESQSSQFGFQCPFQVEDSLVTVKPVLSGHSKIDETKVFKTH